MSNRISPIIARFIDPHTPFPPQSGDGKRVSIGIGCDHERALFIESSRVAVRDRETSNDDYTRIWVDPNTKHIDTLRALLDEAGYAETGGVSIPDDWEEYIFPEN